MKNISNYSQPEFYSFTEESLDLVSFVEKTLPRNRVLNTLDLCAGCGVIGLEAKRRISEVGQLYFLELQEDFISHIKKNIIATECKDYTLVHDSIGNASFLENQFDLILSNPPYFIPGNGRVSLEKTRQICRTFEVDGWGVFFEMINKWLADDGLAYICAKELAPLSPYLADFKILDKLKTSSAWLLCMTRLNKD